MVVRRLTRRVFEVWGDCTSMWYFCWVCWKTHQSVFSGIAFVDVTDALSHQQRAFLFNCRLWNHILCLWRYPRLLLFVFQTFSFSPLRLNEFNGFVWILIWASMYHCHVFFVFHILSAVQCLKTLNLTIFPTSINMRCKLKGLIQSSCSKGNYWCTVLPYIFLRTYLPYFAKISTKRIHFLIFATDFVADKKLKWKHNQLCRSHSKVWFFSPLLVSGEGMHTTFHRQISSQAS